MLADGRPHELSLRVFGQCDGAKTLSNWCVAQPPRHLTLRFTTASLHIRRHPEGLRTLGRIVSHIGDLLPSTSLIANVSHDLIEATVRSRRHLRIEAELVTGSERRRIVTEQDRVFRNEQSYMNESQVC